MGTLAFSEELFGKTRSRILALLFADPDHQFYVREIVNEVASGSGSAQRELAFLERSQLIMRSRRGNQVLYQVNLQHPLYAEIAGLLRKTAGVESALLRALQALGPRVELAAIFGSYAAGNDRPDSDLDVMVIGSATFGEVVEALSETRQGLGREVNPVVYDKAEFSRKIRDGNHFLKTVLSKPLIFLIGDKRELERMGRTRLDRSA